jgi:aryl-alcohol dehydrogenase-like predicted oxidoreductase
VTVQYRYLGRTGLKISAITLGAQTFGWSVAPEPAFALLDQYLEGGGNYVDAADSYNQGESERIVGRWIKERGVRNQLLLGTKVFFPTGPGPNDAGLSRKHIQQSLEESLRRLGTDVVDLYQLHCYDRMTPLEETLRTLDDLVRVGKIRYLGVSNFAPSHLQKAITLTRSHGLAPVAALQLEYSLLVRSPEWELLPQCLEEGVGTLAWSPLAGGWLSGKYRRGQPLPPDSRGGKGDRWDDAAEQRGGERTFAIVDVLHRIASETGRTPAQVALGWMLERGLVTTALIGARTPEQLADNLRAGESPFSEAQLTSLDQVSRLDLPYPYSFIERYTRKG